ncbi:biopolymer transporter ExbD [Fontisphaera persica]|uniref:ExbD/TolR family protein n=1 Tax=Fontisphaera persica TaxID=2974023 RepID=UPI0024C0328D|nr:biopolymer transporter ExbD [Fontisphaera persica]WCJ58168.1 biopolymer transporter ExbD [Fontisphaera persica]
MIIPCPLPRRKARIEVIPLIDIIFFLLATFLMLSLSMVKHRGLPVNLPMASTAVPQERKPQAVVTITGGGKLYYNQEPVERDQLSARLRLLQAEHANPAILISGDAQADFGEVAGVLDEIRRLGLTKVTIATRPPSGK